MNFEWDDIKYRVNLAKHDIRFEDAQTIFADINALEIADDDSTEERFIRIGLNASIGILVVVYCERDGDIIRIISARKATKTERNEYEKRI